MVLGGLVGGGLALAGGLAGGHAGHKARRSMQKRQYEENEALKQGFGHQKRLFRKERDLFGEMFDLLGSGYGNAQAAISNVGQSAYRRIDEGRQRQMGSLQSFMPGASSTLKGNFARGISSDANRAFGEVDEGLAGLRAGLHTGQARAQAGALGGLAGSYRNFMGVRRNYNLDRMKIWLGQQQTIDPQVYQNIGSAGAYIGDAIDNYGGGQSEGDRLRAKGYL